MVSMANFREVKVDVPVSKDALERAVKDPDIPYCSMILVVLILIAHTIVLAGNMSTASAFGSVGTSTKGWSGVGIHLSNSLEHELEDVLTEVITELTEVTQEIMYVQNMMDMVVGLHSKSIDTVVMHNSTKALVLLQAHGIMDASSLSHGLSGMVSKSMTTSLTKLTGALDKAIHKLLKKIKPVLIIVGQFILKFGDKVQAIIEAFSLTLDYVQKVFDQIMAASAGKGSNSEQMEHETFHIFDTTNTGTILPLDLKRTGHVWNIPALQGNKSDDLVKRYDKDGGGDLDRDEFLQMVHDKDVPNLMSVILRSFAKELSRIAGKVGGARFRGEIAMDVADYLELMTQKNRTKVSWICDALSNDSLPLEFTADVIASIALKQDDPNTYHYIPTGQTVVSEMMKLHPKAAGKAIDMLSNATYWTSQGFESKDHAEIVKRITKWSTHHDKDNKSSLAQVIGAEEASALLQNEASVGADGTVDIESPTMLMDRRLVDVMQDLAYNVAQENMQVHLAEIEEEHRVHTDDLLGSDTAQYLLLQLTGGERAAKGKSHPNSPAAMSLKTQIKAAPETLKFAKFLSWNASATAARFQKEATNYQRTSSNTIDSFATQIQSMIKKVQVFIQMMMQYATPDGINRLETMLINYVKKAIKELLFVTNVHVNSALDKHTASLLAGVETPAVDAELSTRIQSALASPLSDNLAPDVTKALGKALNDKAFSGDGADVSKEVAKLFESLANASSRSVAKSLGDTVGKLVNGKASFIESEASIDAFHLEGLGADALYGPADPIVMADIQKDLNKAMHARVNAKEASLLQAGSELVDEEEHQVTGLLQDVVQVLHSIEHIFPQASKALLFARKEVSMLAKTLDNVFMSFSKSGSEIFDEIESMYTEIWTLYWLMMIPIPIILLFYAFWAGGFMGGPGHLVNTPEDKGMSCMDSLKACWCLCFSLCCHKEGVPSCMCFWSAAIMWQTLVLFLFIMGAVVSVVSAVQMFVATGCSAVYILGDQTICGGVLGALRAFLETFLSDVKKTDFGDHCVDTNLLTCNLIGDSLRNSAMMTVLGSFLAAFMTFQLLIESARVHGIAYSRLAIQDAWEEKEA